MANLSTGFRDALISLYGVGLLMNQGVVYVFDGDQPPSADDAAPAPLATITTDGKTFVPQTDPNGAGILLEAVSPGMLKSVGQLRIKGNRTGVATWWRWCWLGPGGLVASTKCPRVDGSVGEELVLKSILIDSNTDDEVGGFFFLLPSGV